MGLTAYQKHVLARSARYTPDADGEAYNVPQHPIDDPSILEKSANQFRLGKFSKTAPGKALTAPSLGLLLGWQYLSPYGGKSESSVHRAL